MRQLGDGFLALPGPESPVERLRAARVDRYFGNFMLDNQRARCCCCRCSTSTAPGPRSAPATSTPQVQRGAARRPSPRRARPRAPTYRFVRRASDNEPLAVARRADLRAAGAGRAGSRRRRCSSCRRWRASTCCERVGSREAQGDVAVFLIDRRRPRAVGSAAPTTRRPRGARLLASWCRTSRAAPRSSPPSTRIFAHGKKRAHARPASAPVEESGWGLVVQKPLSAAFAAVQQLVFNDVVASLLLVVLAGVFAGFAARRVSQPIQRLAETTHEIAAGNFGGRVEVAGPGRELADLAEDFNRMSGHVAELRPAAPAGGAGQPRAVHRLAARLRRGGRRQGPLHPRPLRAGGRATAAPSPAPRPAGGGPAQASGSARCSTTWARSASRTASSRRAACSPPTSTSR